MGRLVLFKISTVLYCAFIREHTIIMVGYIFKKVDENNFYFIRNTTMRTSKGFTIIELLVVVAIIAVLAAIVLVNVTGYINQGKNASIKGNLATVLTNGAVFYDQSGSYSGFCTNAYFTVPQAAVVAAGGTTTCQANGANTAWCSCATLKTTSAEPAGSTYCVDSTGYKKVTQNANGCSTTNGRCTNTGACVD
jgi:prepilin-type N-terminal cleavage/methylation domain-containing protein